LGWTQFEQAREVTLYLERTKADSLAALLGDDAAAANARSQAEEIVVMRDISPQKK
jgi:hypothetical protein